ncbi:hypothetical protein [Erythrobacter sp. EC-HK427]|uniref:hypothetical protein n=1 Tax=Erythrobacter sp. EC-HK427 TaxID=2038396 RepID=UPI00125C1063|nr:hypothetical protein [Erythrobacter sp. EC-HK427]VVT12728.1 conserved exported hypothetical protein [Erythrobacter sp. EC-HK427]
MRALILGLLALLLPASALSQEARLPIAAVTIAPAGDDLHVTITLEQAVQQLHFDPADVLRDDAMHIETPGLAYADNAITGNAPFDRVEFRLVEDLTERDAKYPPFYRIGKGRLLYAQTVYPDLAAWDVTLELAGMPEGWTRWPEAPLPQGYLFLGPESMVVEQGGVRFVFDGNGDAAFEAEIREMVSQSIGLLVDTFGSPPASPPFVATSIIASDRSFSTGDVTSEAMIGLRFMGTAPDPTSRRALASTRSLILHEGVHFWNGGVAMFAQGTPQWLHEGGAEYIATLAVWRLGWSDRAQVQGTFASWLDRCRTALGWNDEVALNDLSFIPSNMRYSCGPLLHLLAELYQGEAESGPGVVQMWRETVGNAVGSGTGEYTLDDWVAASGDASLLDRPALAAILATSGAERWDTVDAEMRRMGVVIEPQTNAPLRARTALMFLIRSQCTALAEGEGYGFYSGAESYRLDTPAGCGLLAGGPVIGTLGGRPLTALTAEDYAHLQALCEAGEPVPLGVVDGDPIEVPCPGDLPEPATQPVITGLPDIPAFQDPAT